MGDINQRSLVGPPARASHADQTIIRSFLRLHNPMRLSKCRPKSRASHGPVGEVPNALAIGRLGIEILHHIPPRQLAEGPGLDPHQLQRPIHPRQVLRPNLIKHVVRERGTAVRTRNRGQAQHLDVWRFEPADHVPGVQSPHAVRHDIDALAMSLFLNVATQFGGALFYGRGRGNRGEDHFDVVGFEGFGDATPVVDAWQEPADEMKLVKAEEAMGEDDGIEGGSCRGLDGVRHSRDEEDTLYLARIRA